MEANKKHKRSASWGKSPSSGVSPSMVKKRWKNSNNVHGKFQAGSKPHVEKKNFDTNTGTLPTTLPSVASAAPTLLNAYTAGTSANAAIGRRVLNKSLLLRMMISSGGGTTFTGCRVAVVYDRESNGAAPAFSDVFQSPGTNGTASANNLDNGDRFSILMDEKFMVAPGASTAPTDKQTYYLDRYIKLGLESVAKGGSFTGAITGIATGSIYLFAWSDTAAASNPPVVIAAVSRVRFQDG